MPLNGVGRVYWGGYVVKLQFSTPRLSLISKCQNYTTRNILILVFNYTQFLRSNSTPYLFKKKIISFSNPNDHFPCPHYDTLSFPSPQNVKSLYIKDTPHQISVPPIYCPAIDSPNLSANSLRCSQSQRHRVKDSPFGVPSGEKRDPNSDPYVRGIT